LREEKAGQKPKKTRGGQVINEGDLVKKKKILIGKRGGSPRTTEGDGSECRAETKGLGRSPLLGYRGVRRTSGGKSGKGE